MKEKFLFEVCVLADACERTHARKRWRGNDLNHILASFPLNNVKRNYTPSVK